MLLDVAEKCITIFTIYGISHEKISNSRVQEYLTKPTILMKQIKEREALKKEEKNILKNNDKKLKGKEKCPFH